MNNRLYGKAHTHTIQFRLHLQFQRRRRKQLHGRGIQRRDPYYINHKRLCVVSLLSAQEFIFLSAQKRRRRCCREDDDGSLDSCGF